MTVLRHNRELIVFFLSFFFFAFSIAFTVSATAENGDTAVVDEKTVAEETVTEEVAEETIVDNSDDVTEEDQSSVEATSTPEFVEVQEGQPEEISSVVGNISDEDNSTSSVCQLSPSNDGDVLVEIGDFIRSDKDQSSAEGDVLDVSIPAGKYNITLQSFDNHSEKPDQTQTNESWYLKLSDEGSVLGQTSSISDLPDDENHLIETVDTDFVVTTDIKKVQSIHAVYPDTNPNSIEPVCALFEKVVEPEPEIGYCPLELKDGRTIVDFSAETVRLRSDSSESQSKESFNVSIPAGTYDVTLVGADAYEDRVNVSQPNESYFLELFSGSASIAFTGFLDDLLDNVIAATSTTVVNTKFSIAQDIDSVVATHSVYPDTSSSNSITIVCAAFDKVDGGGGNGNCIAPEFTSSSTIDTKIGEFVSYTITASSTTDTTFSLDTSILPDGLTFDGVDTISGTTTVAGSFNINVAVSNDCEEINVNLAINVVGIGQCLAPELTSSNTIDVKVGDFVSYTISASSTTATSFSVATSSLPDGLTFDEVNTISGTTTTVGAFNVNVTLSNICEDVVVSLTFNITEDTDGGDNGGGNGGGGGTITGGRAGTGGRVLGTTTAIGTCAPLLTDYLRLGYDNNPDQVRLLQAFLKGVEGYDVDVTGIFDERTDSAVRSFQLKYADDVLAPWGLEESTGYVYYTTQKKINEIYCEREFPLTEMQAEEIEMCRLMQLGEHFGIGGDQFGDQGQTGGQIGQATSTAVTLTLTDTTGDDNELAVKEESEESFLEVARDRIRDVAAAAITFPQTPRDTVYYALWLILILALVYIIGSLTAGIRDTEVLDQSQLRIRKITYFIAGTVAGLVVAILLKLTSLIIPLIVVIVLLSIGLLYYSRNTVK